MPHTVFVRTFASLVATTVVVATIVPASARSTTRSFEAPADHWVAMTGTPSAGRAVGPHPMHHHCHEPYPMRHASSCGTATGGPSGGIH